MIAIAIILPVLTVVIKVILNYKMWKKGKPVNHLIEWLIMAAVNIPAIIILGGMASVNWFEFEGFWFKSEWLNQVIEYLIPSAMIAFFIWLFFDGVYNLKRGFYWWFTGGGGKGAAKTDNFLQTIPLWLHIVIKFGWLAGFIFLYWLIFKH